MRVSESIKGLAQALVKAQAEIKNPTKESQNPHYRSRYADLATCLDAIREPFAKHGLMVLQGPVATEAGWFLVTRLLHTSGEWIEADHPILMPKGQGPQDFGSSLTYARRYALMAMTGIAGEDDDGEAGQKSFEQHRTPHERRVAGADEPSAGNQKKTPPNKAPGAARGTDPIDKWDAQRLKNLASEKGMTLEQLQKFIFERTGKEFVRDLTKTELDLVLRMFAASNDGSPVTQPPPMPNQDEEQPF